MRIKLDNHEMLSLHISGSFPMVMCIEIKYDPEELPLRMPSGIAVRSKHALVEV